MRLIRALLLLSLIILCCNQASADTTPAVVRIDPASLTIGQGEVGSFDVVIDNANQLNGVDLQVRFDPMVIEVLDADPETAGVQVAVGDMPHADVVVRNIVDNARGVMYYAVVQLSSSQPANGQGVIFSFDARAKVNGSQSQLAIQVTLADRSGSDQPVQVQNGAIVIGSGGTVQTTATPSASATPTLGSAVPTSLPSPTLAAAPTITPTASATTATAPPVTPFLTATATLPLATPSANIQLAATAAAEPAPSPTPSVARSTTASLATPTPQLRPTTAAGPMSSTPAVRMAAAITTVPGIATATRPPTPSPLSVARSALAVTPTTPDDSMATAGSQPSSVGVLPMPLAPLSGSSSALLGDLLTYGAALIMILAAIAMLIWLYRYMKNT